MILDIILPGMDGLELCRRLRAHSESLPLLFLSSRDEEIDRVLGLELGADDYLCKPFSVRELLARVKVLFRRAAPERARGAEGQTQPRVVCGPLVLDSYTASWGGTGVPLTVTEFRILHALARQAGVVRIRRKLSRADPDSDAIETIYGLGYRYRQPGH